MLTTRRSQSKLAVAAMVRECCTFVDQMPDKETKLKLIESLRKITEGKVNNSMFISKLEQYKECVLLNFIINLVY